MATLLSLLLSILTRVILCLPPDRDQVWTRGARTNIVMRLNVLVFILCAVCLINNACAKQITSTILPRLYGGQYYPVTPTIHTALLGVDR